MHRKKFLSVFSLLPHRKSYPAACFKKFIRFYFPENTFLLSFHPLDIKGPVDLLAEHNITQSMSRKGNCMDNGAMENFFGRLKVEMFYGEHFQTVNEFINCLKEYIDYYNNERIVSK